MDPSFDMLTVEGFVNTVTATIDVVKDGIQLFTTPPLSYFVALGFLAAGVSIARRLIPSRR